MLGCYSASVDVIHLGIEAGAAAAAARGKQSTACLPAPSSLTPTTPATHSYACPMTQTELSRGVDGTPAAQLQSEQPAAWRARHEAPTPAEPCLRQF
jgi:hypothetical protein